jgi:hypothetical protein
MTKGVKAESNPFSMDTIIDMNIKVALIISAFPMLVDIAFTFISSVSAF